MRSEIKNDNKYAVGTRLVARDHPHQKLIIQSYQQRIYYCSQEDAPEGKQLAYYERELMALPEEAATTFKQVQIPIEMVRRQVAK